VEFLSEKIALELLAQKSSARHSFPLHPGAGEIGMLCGGDVEVWMQFVDAADPRWAELAGKVTERIDRREKGWLVQKLDGSVPILAEEPPLEEEDCLVLPLPIGERAVIFGGGHCSQALVPLLHSVGFRVTVMDCREEFATSALFPQAEQVICGDYEKICDVLTLTEEDYIVVLTSGHTFDFAVQEQVLRGPFAYIGVIGSRSKTAAVNQRLRECGISEEAISKVHTPIGTAIKAVTPAEIAVSIAGEMIYERAVKREGRGEIRRGCPMHE
jgi:xanthine dehydrogenase accessory factor